MLTSSENTLHLTRRPRRNRLSPAIRSLVRETTITTHDLVQPLFVQEGYKEQTPIESMPGIFRRTLDLLQPYVKQLYRLGIRAVDLFALTPQEKKDRLGSAATDDSSLIFQAIDAIKQAEPNMCVMVDIALDPYTDTGHDGICDDRGYVINDASVERLAHMACLAATKGADVVAPSDMMDGRVGAIRKELDRQGYTETGILSYTAKYASAFYGPFRDALHSAPQFGDKSTYQMDPANIREALVEALLDEKEGADILLCKPALAYLDVIQALYKNSNLPIAAYHVSGEYAMAWAAHEKGWLDGPSVIKESLTSIKRAGASIIFTYAAEWLAEQI